MARNARKLGTSIRRGVASAAVLALVLAACGDDSDDSDSSDDTTTETEAAADDADSGSADDAAAEDESSEGEAAPSAGGSGGTAQVALDNGETYDVSGVLCMLESQEAAGSEILFNAVAYENPQMDVTQFGSEGIVNDVATVSVFATEDYQSYDYYWEADSTFGDLVLSLDGSQITGSGTFFDGGTTGEIDPFGEGVAGTVEVNC